MSVEGYARANSFGLVDERRRISSAIYPFFLFSSVSQSIAHPHPDRSIHFLVMVMVIASEPIATTAEPAYSYNVYSRFSAIVELNLVPFAFISLFFYIYISIYFSIFLYISIYFSKYNIE